MNLQLFYISGICTISLQQKRQRVHKALNQFFSVLNPFKQNSFISIIHAYYPANCECYICLASHGGRNWGRVMAQFTLFQILLRIVPTDTLLNIDMVCDVWHWSIIILPKF